MASTSVFSESPGSELSEAGPTTSESSAHFSFPFSIIRSQRGAISQGGAATSSSSVSGAPRGGTPGSASGRKSFQERVPTFKSMMNLMTLREEHARVRAAAAAADAGLGCDSALTNGSMSSKPGGYPKKLAPGREKVAEEGVTLVWRDLTVTVGDRRERGVSKAVQSVTGYARPGTMLAIMGPPDSGKSTLLRALAGKLPTSAKVYGEIMRNGQRHQLKTGTYAFVMKDGDLTETLTIRETLFYAALLQLPNRISCYEKISRVDSLIAEMDLESLAGTRIGVCGERGGLTRGQRRRLSIALQLLSKPWLIFVDDPISTLDSLSAFVIMGMLKKLANNGCTVVISLEQMSTEIFNVLDKVCILSSGHTIFFGPATAAIEHYANAGMVCPPNCNPADHLLQAINTDYDRLNGPARFAQDSEHGDMWGEMDTAVIIRTLESSYQASGDAAVVQSMVTHLSEKEKTRLSRGGRPNMLIGLGVLTWRSFLNMWRDFNYFWLRLIFSTLLTLCIGTLGSKIGHSYAALSARVAAIFSMVSTVSLMAVAGFPSVMKDVKVHLAEREAGHSGVLIFTVANLLSSALYLFLISIVCTSVGYFLLGLQTDFSPFVYYVVNLFLCLVTVEGLMLLVAAVVPRFLEGLMVVVGIQVLMIIVAGFYQVSGDIPEPVWRYPASYLPFHGYAVEGLLQNEYGEASFASSSRRTPPISGQTAIDRAYPFPVTTLGKWNILMVLAGMSGAYRVLFCVFLLFCQKLRLRICVE